VTGLPVLREQAEESVPAESNPPARTIAVLALASAITPFAVDTYLSGLPRIAREFGVSTSTVQLTLTAFLFGLAFGQLVIGPLSDGIGRRKPLLIGSAICIGASILCAVAPSVELLIAARFVQGFTGAAGAVLGRAVIADRTKGEATARYFSLLMVTAGVAPIIAPVTGAALIGSIGWRGVLWVVAAVTVLMSVSVATSIPESLPPERRHSGGLRGFVIRARGVLGNRSFVGYTAAFSFGFMTMFAWVSASPFVLQDMFGLSTAHYALAFATCAGALLTANATNARIVGRVGAHNMARLGLTGLCTSSALMAVNVGVGTYLWPTLILTASAIGSMGFLLSNCAALAIGQVRHAAGTGSAILGASQFGLGAVVAPVVGLGGSHSAVPLGISMICTATIAAIAFVSAARGSAR
jgi:MFS transporter, DHA1 family, multidrug resistance protein